MVGNRGCTTVLHLDYSRKIVVQVILIKTDVFLLLLHDLFSLIINEARGDLLEILISFKDSTLLLELTIVLIYFIR